MKDVRLMTFEEREEYDKKIKKDEIIKNKIDKKIIKCEDKELNTLKKLNSKLTKKIEVEDNKEERRKKIKAKESREDARRAKIVKVRDMYILKNMELKDIAKETGISYNTIAKWSSKYKWGFIKGEVNDAYGSDLLNLGQDFVEVYMLAFDRIKEKLSSEDTMSNKGISDLMTAFVALDTQIRFHYGTAKLVKKQEDQESTE